MDVALYTSDQGTLLLVPACMQPAHEAQRLYGPLQPCAKAHLAHMRDPVVRARVERDIDHHAYALVTVAEVKSLLGARHRCLRRRSAGFWPRLGKPRNTHAGMRLS